MATLPFWSLCKNLSFSKSWLGNLKEWTFAYICYKQKVTSRKHVCPPPALHLLHLFSTTIKGAEFQPARGFQRPANENRDLRTPGLGTPRVSKRPTSTRILSWLLVGAIWKLKKKKWRNDITQTKLVFVSEFVRGKCLRCRRRLEFGIDRYHLWHLVEL